MKPKQPPRAQRYVYPEELKEEAVPMLLDGHSAVSVAEHLGLPHPSLLYRWKAQALDQAGTVASALEVRVRQLEEQLRRTERERDILKKAFHFQPADLKEVYPVIQQLEQAGFPVAVVCQTLGVSRAGYYARGDCRCRPTRPGG